MVIKSRENLFGAWAFLFGVILAVLLGFTAAFTKITIDPMFLGLLAVLGLVVGYFVAEKNVQTFLIAAVSLVVVSFAGMQGLVLGAAFGGVQIGKVITQVLGALLFMFVPAAIIVAIKTAFSIAKS